MQKYKSVSINLNQVPAIIKYLEKINELKNGRIVLNYRSSKYSKTRKIVEGAYNPPENAEDVNKAALSVKINIVNVLNVIRALEKRIKSLKTINSQMKQGARLYIRTYNALKSKLYIKDSYPG